MHREKANQLPDHTTEKELADEFNVFFKQKVDKIRETFCNNCERAFDYVLEYKGEHLDSFSQITVKQMERILRASNAKTCSLDPIPSSEVKDCAKELAPIICRIVNLSLANAQFPEKYKHAVIRPLLKKNLARYRTQKLPSRLKPYVCR